jgi:hypothetical protein
MTHDEEYDMNLFEDACNKAKRKGLKVVQSTRSLLLVDIDTKEQWDLYQERKRFIENRIPFAKTQIVPSVSGGEHRHVYIRLEKSFPIAERIAMQMFLGSDPIREMLSLRLITFDDVCPSLFFEKPDFVLDV